MHAWCKTSWNQKTTECSRVLLLRSCAPACCIHSGQVLVSVRGPDLAVRFSPGLSARGEPSWINAPAASIVSLQVYLALVLQRFRGFSAYLCTLCLTCASPSQSGTASGPSWLAAPAASISSLQVHRSSLTAHCCQVCLTLDSLFCNLHFDR